MTLACSKPTVDEQDSLITISHVNDHSIPPDLAILFKELRDESTYYATVSRNLENSRCETGRENQPYSITSSQKSAISPTTAPASSVPAHYSYTIPPYSSTSPSHIRSTHIHNLKPVASSKTTTPSRPPRNKSQSKHQQQPASHDHESNPIRESSLRAQATYDSSGACRLDPIAPVFVSFHPGVCM